jgi:hypothetical protein
MPSPQQPSETAERYGCCILTPETEDLISVLTCRVAAPAASDAFVVSNISAAVNFAVLKRFHSQPPFRPRGPGAKPASGIPKGSELAPKSGPVSGAPKIKK